jgi:hypothetical protein
MNLKDRFFEWLLAFVDRNLDRITSGSWTRVRGDVVPNIKIKE